MVGGNLKLFSYLNYKLDLTKRKLGPKTDSSQKSATLKQILRKYHKDLKIDPKIKNYNVILHTLFKANEFTRE